MSNLRFLATGIGLMVCAFLVMPWDVAIAQYFSGENNLPGDVRRLVRLSEVFAHGLGVAMILITALVLDWARRKQILWAGISAYACGGLANIAKMVVGRSRPHSTDLSAMTAMESFGDWFPSFQNAPWTHAMQSFPSAHTATGVGFALGLAVVYPQGRLWFAFLAALAAVQRLECGAHYLSDVTAGAGVAFLVFGVVNRYTRRIGP